VESQKLSIGTVLSRVFSLYTSESSVWVPVSALIIGLPAILSAVIEYNGGALLKLLALIVVFVAEFVFAGMVVELVASVEKGTTHPNAGGLIRSVMPVLGSLIVVSIVAGIAIGIGFILIIIPGLILLTIWAVFVPIIVLENPGGLKALSESRAMVRGNGWQVFGVIVILFLLVALIEGLIVGAAVAASLGLGIVVSVVVRVLTAPISSLAAAVMYFELKRAGGPSDQTEPFEPVDVPPAGVHEPPSDPFGKDY
jgi:hypothetical protein